MRVCSTMWQFLGKRLYLDDRKLGRFNYVEIVWRILAVNVCTGRTRGWSSSVHLPRKQRELVIGL